MGRGRAGQSSARRTSECKDRRARSDAPTKPCRKLGRTRCRCIELLADFCKYLIITVMKLALAVLVYVLIGVVLGAGILLAVAGKPWFLIAAFIAYVVAFGKIGCMTH